MTLGWRFQDLDQHEEEGPARAAHVTLTDWGRRGAAGGHLALGPAPGRAIAALADAAFIPCAVIAWWTGFQFGVAIAELAPEPSKRSRCEGQ